MTTLPTKPGFYWAKWKIATDGTREGAELTPSDKWEVVEVWDNTNAPPDERFLVHVPGVEQSQMLDGFFWGPGPLPAPGVTA